MILDWRPFDSYLRECSMGDVRIREMCDFEQDGPGCRVTSIWGATPGSAEASAKSRELIRMFAPMLEEEFARLERIVTT